MRNRIHTGVEVLQIGKDQLAKKDYIGKPERLKHPFRILLRSRGREFIHKTSSVVDASGVYSCPQSLGSGNLPAPGERQAHEEATDRLQYGVVDVLVKDRPRFENKRVLLVGGGHSAATVLEAFLSLVRSASKTQVFWINRSSRNQPYLLFQDDPLLYRDQLSRLGNQLATHPPSWLRYYGESGVEAITSWPGKGLSGEHRVFEVVVESPRGSEKLEVDQIVACVGFRPDRSLYRQLQVHECYATVGPMKLAAALLGGSSDCLAQESHGIETLTNPEPNFFILGNKSYGTNTTFLLTHGIEQVETVMNYLQQKQVTFNDLETQ